MSKYFSPELVDGVFFFLVVFGTILFIFCLYFVNSMIQILQPCYVFQDNGSYCGDGCCWNAWWESEPYNAGDELDDDDPKFDLSGLTDGEDYVKI